MYYYYFFLFFLQFFMFNGFAVLLPISMRRSQSNQVWQKPCVLSRFAAKPLFALCIDADADCAYNPFFEDRIHMWIPCKIHAMCVCIWLAMVGNLSPPLRNYYTGHFLVHFLWAFKWTAKEYHLQVTGKAALFSWVEPQISGMSGVIHPTSQQLQLVGEWKCCRWVAELLGTFGFGGICHNSWLWLQKWRYFVLLNMLIWTRAMRYATF